MVGRQNDEWRRELFDLSLVGQGMVGRQNHINGPVSRHVSLVVRECSAEAKQSLVEVADTLDHAPIVSTHFDLMTKQGVLTNHGACRPRSHTRPDHDPCAT